MAIVNNQHKNLLIITVALILAYLLFDLLIVLFITFLIVTAFLPLVRFLEKKNIPKVFSSVILVTTIFAAVLGLLLILGPAIVSQTQSLFERTPQLLQTLQARTGLSIPSDIFQDFISQAGSYVISFSTTAFTVLVSTVAIIVLTVYGLIYYDETSKSIIAFAARNRQQQNRYEKLQKNIETSVGTWVKGQMLTSTIIGLLTWFAYIILGLPFAGTLAILAGFLELLPGLGPTLAAIPALIIALTISPQMFFLVLAAYLIIQAIESYIITPRIMSRVIRLNPFMTIVVVLAGTFLLGILGAFLAIPFALVGSAIYEHFNSGDRS